MQISGLPSRPTEPQSQESGLNEFRGGRYWGHWSVPHWTRNKICIPCRPNSKWLSLGSKQDPSTKALGEGGGGGGGGCLNSYGSQRVANEGYRKKGVCELSRNQNYTLSQGWGSLWRKFYWVLGCFFFSSVVLDNYIGTPTADQEYSLSLLIAS